MCEDLRRRGYHAINGDRELSYQGDPETGEPLDGSVHAHHIWDVVRVKSAVADQRNAISFFCGGSRNSTALLICLTGFSFSDVDLDTLNRRLAGRPEDEFGGRASERELIVRLHTTKEDVPKNAVSIDATAPIARVVDEILSKCREAGQGPASKLRTVH